MNNLHRNSTRVLAVSASVLALASAVPAWAQDVDATCPVGTERVGQDCVIQSEGPDGVTNDDPTASDVVDITDTGATGQEVEGAIVVTGSRIRRDTY